jgi:hypothetical protein
LTVTHAPLVDRQKRDAANLLRIGEYDQRCGEILERLYTSVCESGPAIRRMKVADRALVANMAPEYGATMGFFPIDEQTLHYLRLTGRSDAEVALVERPLGFGSVQMCTAAHVVRAEESEMPGWRGYAASFDDFALRRDDHLPPRYHAR